MEVRAECPRSILARAREALSSWRSLLDSAACLLGAEIVASLIGFAFWGAAARLYTPQQVGLASAVLAAVTLVSSIAGLGTSTGLARFLPLSLRPCRLLNSITTLNVACGVLVGTWYLAGARIWCPSLAFLWQDARLAVAFIAFVASSALGTVAKMAFVARHRARYALCYTCTVNVGRLLLLLSLRPLGGIGLVGSVAMACAVATALSLWRHLPRVVAGYRPRLQLNTQDLTSTVPYSLANYLAGLLVSSSRTLLPLMVVETLGQEANAHAYTALMVGALLASPAAALSTAAFAEGAHAPRRMDAILRPVTVLSLGLSVPAAATLAAAAPQVLSLFGASYAREAAGLMRWLALAAPLVALKELYLARLRVEARMRGLIACSAASSLLTLALSAVLMPRLGISGIGTAILAGEGLLALPAMWGFLTGGRQHRTCFRPAAERGGALKIALVCSHGGHLTEMEMLGPALTGHRCFLVTYHSPRTESLSGPHYLLRNIGASPWRMLGAFAQATWILWRERPDVVLSTGSEIAIPFLWIGRAAGARTVYLESCCRVTGPSRTGPLVYPVSDLFLVQWPALLACYGPRARYVGGLM